MMWKKIDEEGNEWKPLYSEVLDYGFVGLIDFMGSDSAIAEAARVSYAGGGTKKVNSDEGLIRYLLRHRHTTPFEMCEVKFHVKAPIFVFRQWHRHRTASINEMSARYSILDNEMYIPSFEDAAPQSSNNKQGRAGELSDTDYTAVAAAMEQTFDQAYSTYKYLLGFEEVVVDGTPHTIRPNPPDAIQLRKLVADESAMNSLVKERDTRKKKGEDWSPTEEEITARKRQFYEANGLAVTTEDFPGLARESARSVLPVATYTQMYWKTNLWNLFNFLRLRMDAHAQKEIRVYAEAMYDQIAPLFPVAAKAFDDYIAGAKTLSKQEVSILQQIVRGELGSDAQIRQYAESISMSKREVDEFLSWVRR